MKKFWGFLSLITLALSANGIDMSDLYDINTVQCFVRNGAQFAIIQASTDSGQLDPSASQNINEIKQLGLPTDIYLRICRGLDPAKQVKDVMDALPSNNYNNVWVYIVDNQVTGCNWGNYTERANCAFVDTVISTITKRGKSAGVFSSDQNWIKIFGKIDACPQPAKFPLWYQYPDDNPSFDNFRSFGGWKVPSMKQYSTNYVWCGTQRTNLDYKL